MRKLSISEYNMLRSEINMRIGLINTQENTALVMSIAFWAGCFGTYKYLLDVPVNQIDFVFSGIVLISLHFFHILLLIPIAHKSGENIYQIKSIATYLMVMYEWPSLSVNNENVLFWESCNNKTNGIFSSINSRRSISKSFNIAFMNNSYIILSCVSMIMILFSAIFVVWKYLNAFNVFPLLFTLYTSVVFVCAIIMGVDIGKASSVKRNMIDKEKQLIDNYRNLAYRFNISNKNVEQTVANK